MKKIFLKLLIPMLLGFGIIFSFFREMIIAYYYGSSQEVEIYRVAFAIPYALFQSLGTILVSSLLPLYLIQNNIILEIKKKVQIVFILVTIIALLTAKWQASVLAPGFDAVALQILTLNLMICWVIMLFSALIFPLRLTLQKNDRKYLVSATSLLFSLFFIILIIFIHGKFSNFELSIASVISVMVVYIVFIIFHKKESTLIKKLQKSDNANKKIQLIIFGSFIYVFLLTIPRLIDKAIASKMGVGVIANLDYAMNFYVAFGVLIGTSFGIIFAKEIATHYSEKGTSLKWLAKLIGIPFLLATVVSSLLYPFAETLVTLAYYRGAFTQKDIIDVTEILRMFLLALPFMVGGMVLSQIIAAYSIFILIGVISFKLLGKYLWIYFAQDKFSLTIFGESTLMMEIIGILIIALILMIYANPKVLSKVEK